MESIARDVRTLLPDERRLYESAVGHALREDQRVIIHVVELEDGPDESVRRAVMEDFHELCRQGTENRERQGISIGEADQALEEAVRAVRDQKKQ